MKVVFSDRAYASILAETTEKIKTETGGLYLGTVKQDIWYVIEAIDPGPKSIFEVAYFEYDQAYTQHLINKIANMYEQKLVLIGLWHRHPGSMDYFSNTDDETNAKYARLNEKGAISALVNIDPDFRLTVYHVEQPCHYTKIPYEVGDHLVPDELLQYKTPEHFKKLMNQILHAPAAQSQKKVVKHKKPININSFMNYILPALKNHVCEAFEQENCIPVEEIQDDMMDEIFDDLDFFANNFDENISLAVTKNALCMRQVVDEKEMELRFMASDEPKAMVVCYKGVCYTYYRGMFIESYRKVKSLIEKAKKEKTAADASNKQEGIFSTMLNRIKYRRNED